MKTLLAGMVLVAGAGLLLAGQAGEAKQEQGLVGTWKIVKFETPQGPQDDFKDSLLIFAANGKAQMVRDGKEHKKGDYKVNASAKPRQIDITDPEGKAMLGIYEVTKDTLKIAVCPEGGAARPTSFAAKDDAVLMTLERSKK